MCDSNNLIESSVVHLPFVGLAGFSYYRKHTLSVFPLVISQSNNRRHSLSRLELEDLSDLLYTPNFLKSCWYSGLSWTIVNLTCFAVDTILGIPPDESYNGIRALVDLSVCVKIYQQ